MERERGKEGRKGDGMYGKEIMKWKVWKGRKGKIGMKGRKEME